MTLTRLFFLVVSLASVAFGGGSVIMTGLERELVGGGWITPAQFAAGVALGQSTPGPLASFTTAIGNYTLGLAGAAVATAGLLVVSLCAVMLIRVVPVGWFQHPRVRGALAVVPPYVSALVLFLALRMLITGPSARPLLPVLITGGVVVGRLKKVPTPALMIGAVLIGMSLQGAW